MAEWVRALDTHQVVLGSNTTATSLRNFGNSVYPTFPVYFGGDTKSRRLLLLSMPGEVKDPTSLHHSHSTEMTQQTNNFESFYM